jgi:HK97 family phage major capsid protein|tara:strand:+ start:212 stop:1054 length:843 start_codon:yes stop_codon:yes gene_type:complete
MANETTSSTISELYTEIVAEAMFTASEQSIMKGLVRNYTIAGGGKSVEVPIYPTVSASAVNEATDLSNTAINPTSVTITASEVGLMTTLTDLARNSASRNVAQDIGRVFGEAIARKIDLDLTALFDGFSVAVGGTGATLTADTVAQAHANLRNNSVPMNDLALVLHPMVAHDLKRGMTNTYAGLDTDISNEALRSGFIGTLFGVPVFETANMANTGDAGDYKGAMFHRDALGLAMMQDLKIEVQRDASLRADEIVATAVYGVAELQDSYGIEIGADSTIQ